MFSAAIEQATSFTRPIHSIVRYWETTVAEPNAATLFFVNNEGWALTCKHVAQLFFTDINQRFIQFKADCAALKPEKKSRNAVKKIGENHGFTKGAIIQLLNNLMNCVDGTLDLRAELHPTVDVALLQFQNYNKLLCDHFPTFAKDGAQLRPGMQLCRLGFPFPEFDNFEYDAASDSIRWTNTGTDTTPQFPLDGMVTRRLRVADKIIGFEISTPGLKGQSGGPAIDCDGRIWGMQCATHHLDLNFDINVDVMRSGSKLHVKEHAFLHVGHCVHIDVLKDFMRQHGVSFAEG